MSFKTLEKATTNAAPSTPSITRWSYERERGSISFSFFSLVRETPNIATSGGFIIGVKKEPPIPPKLDTVIEPP